MSCPRCGADNGDLVTIETSMKVALSAAGESSVPPMVCSSCLAELTSSVSQGMKLRIEQEAKEKNKVMLWKTRVNFIKQGRVLMAHKSYSEAAVCYEKYLRVLEMVYNLNKGELTPSIFNNSKKSKELTVITSVYWDLMRIYDTSPKYGDRMAQSAQKLSEFLPFSPVLPDIIKRAESFSRSAKNPSVVRNFLKSVRKNSSKCFIATAVFETSESPEVLILREFRDSKLLSSYFGHQFVLSYYRHSPVIANWIERYPKSKIFLKPALRLVAVVVKKSLKSEPDSYKP